MPSGVLVLPDQPTIVFVTACLQKRRNQLADPEAHQLLLAAWSKASAWCVGRYMIMPDHVHLFTAPRDMNFSIEAWTRFWKSIFSQSHQHADWSWQTGAFHHRIRDAIVYQEKLDYVRQNPARAGLVVTPDAWPYQGELHPLIW